MRGDVSFFGKRAVEFLDSARVGYALVASEYRRIKALAQGCPFTKLRTGWELGKIRYQPSRWYHPHRFVGVRWPIHTDPVEAKQITFFKDKTYAERVLLTNLTTQSWRV